MDDEELLAQAEQALTEIKVGQGLSEQHASVLAALRIRLKGSAGKSLEEMLEAAGGLGAGGRGGGKGAGGGQARTPAPARPWRAPARAAARCRSRASTDPTTSHRRERAGPQRARPVRGTYLLTSTPASDEASSGRPSGTCEVGESVGFCRSPGERAGWWPRPARGGSAADHPEGLLVSMQVGRPPSSPAAHSATERARRRRSRGSNTSSCQSLAVPFET